MSRKQGLTSVSEKGVKKKRIIILMFAGVIVTAPGLSVFLVLFEGIYPLPVSRDTGDPSPTLSKKAGREWEHNMAQAFIIIPNKLW